MVYLENKFNLNTQLTVRKHMKFLFSSPLNSVCRRCIILQCFIKKKRENRETFQKWQWLVSFTSKISASESFSPKQLSKNICRDIYVLVDS